MAATFLQMKTRIANNAIRDVDTDGTFIGEAIVAAIKFCNNKGGKFWFLEANDTTKTLIASENTITLPTDFNKLIRVRVSVNSRWITDGNGLEQTTYDDIKLRDVDANYTSQPVAYALFSNMVRFYPTSDNTYSVDIDYYKKDATLPSADGDTSVWMGDEAENLIYYIASSRYHGDTLHDEQKRVEFSALAQAEWDALIKANNKRKYKNTLG